MTILQQTFQQQRVAFAAAKPILLRLVNRLPSYRKLPLAILAAADRIAKFANLAEVSRLASGRIDGF